MMSRRCGKMRASRRRSGRILGEEDSAMMMMMMMMQTLVRVIKTLLEAGSNQHF